MRRLLYAVAFPFVVAVITVRVLRSRKMVRDVRRRYGARVQPEARA